MEVFDQRATLITAYAPEGGVLHLESGFVDTAAAAGDLVGAAA